MEHAKLIDKLMSLQKSALQNQTGLSTRAAIKVAISWAKEAKIITRSSKTLENELLEALITDMKKSATEIKVKQELIDIVEHEMRYGRTVRGTYQS